MRIDVTTRINEGDGKIYQEVVTVNDTDGIRTVISHQVICTKEAQVRDALIALGWNPPNRRNLSELVKDQQKLCELIEKLDASELQTNISVLASEIKSSLDKVVTNDDDNNKLSNKYVEDVEKALRAVAAGNAYHWPTIAAILADEVLRLRSK